MLGHRVEKCRKNVDSSYDEIVVKKYEMQMRSTKKIREILNKFMDTQRKQEYRDKQNIEIELAKSRPQKTSLMIGRTEIPKWIGAKMGVRVRIYIFILAKIGE